MLNDVNFHQEKSFSERISLSDSEILEMKDYVDFQSHSVFHPFLHKCDDNESEFEISTSKNQLEQKYLLSINTFSYPNGDYSKREIELLKKYGYKAGITCDLWFNGKNTEIYRLKRLDCRDNATFYELESKVAGIYHFLKRLLTKKQFGFQKINH